MSVENNNSVIVDGGWWPPGDGEPGESWDYEPAELKLMLDDGEDNIDVVLPTPDGDRALVSLPIEALALFLVQQRLSSS